MLQCQGNSCYLVYFLHHPWTNFFLMEIPYIDLSKSLNYKFFNLSINTNNKIKIVLFFNLYPFYRPTFIYKSCFYLILCKIFIKNITTIENPSIASKAVSRSLLLNRMFFAKVIENTSFYEAGFIKMPWPNIKDLFIDKS